MIFFAILRTLTRQTAAAVVVNLIPDLTVTPRFRRTEHAAAVGRRVVRFNEALTGARGRYGFG